MSNGCNQTVHTELAMDFILWTILLIGLYSPALADDSYVVLAPKIIRPGLTSQIQVNTFSNSAANIKIELLQDGQVKYTSNQAYGSGKLKSGQVSLSVPDDLKPGSAKLKVTVTGAITHQSEADVTVQAKSVSIFIQTDKAMYKPSQTVNFRVVVVDPKLLPYNGACDVEIKDPQGNKIKVWKRISLEKGVLTQKLELSDQPVLGDWVIKAITDKGESKEKKFAIDKYVLPKFEVDVDLPSYMLVGAKSMKAKINTKYTYGKGVEGTAIVRVSRKNAYREWISSTRTYRDPPTVEFKDIRLNDGKAEVTLTSAHLTELSYARRGLNNRNTLIVEVNVTETLTGITRPGKSEVTFYTTAEKLEYLESTPTSFKPGLKYTGFMKLSLVDGGVVTNPKKINLRIGYGSEPAVTPYPSSWRYPYISPRYTYSDKVVNVQDNGIAQFSIDVPAATTTITLDAKYNNQNSVSAYKTIKQTHSPSDTFIQLVLQSSNLKAGDEAIFSVTTNKPSTGNFYQVLARGSIVDSGIVDLSSGTLRLKILPSMAPSARIIVYSVFGSNKELIADSLNFNVDGAFKNQVDVSYSKQKAQPGESVDVQVSAATGSLVGLLAVDQSVLLLAQGNDITQNDVLGELRSYDSISTSGSLPRFGWWWYPYSISGTDVATILKNSGLVALTNTLVYKHKEIGHPIRPIWDFDGIAMARAGAFGQAGGVINKAVAPVAPGVASGGNKPSPGAKKTEIKVRKLFPESWLWTNSTSVNGKAVITTTVPDTITSWVATAFAVSPSAGLGVASDSAKLQVFKPFFVSLNLPYSVVRGEQVVLQAIVFNYLEKDVTVTVTLPKSSEYRSIVISADGTTSYVEQEQTVTITASAGKGTTVSFPIIPATIGNIRIRATANAAPHAADAVQRDLLVEAEGVEKSYNQAILIDLKNSSTFTKTVAIDFPDNVVADSQRVEFSLVGDIMGPSINGLDKLIKMPYGCGEQNMLNFAPTIFVSEYLESAGQLSSDLKTKSLGFMEKGYQRELTYQRDDGSFSAFGQRDDSGSMWLTAFVAKSFQKARKFIYVDEETILRAVTWIVNKQNKDGSFPEPGRVIHKEMMGGGASSKITLTSYVLSALAEVKVKSTEFAPKLASAKAKAISYIESKTSTLQDPYSLALCAYSLQRAGSQKVDAVISSLDALSKNEGGMQYWEQPQPEPAKNTKVWRPPHHQTKAVNIELAAYAVLVKTERQGVVSALPIVRWISGQRNKNGGFSSTQDTVVALQALSSFAGLAMSGTNMAVTLTAAGHNYNYNVDQSNRLVLQSRTLDSEVATVRIQASGKGIALAQVSATYNVEDYEQEPAFETTAAVTDQKSNSITVKVCTKWLLPGASGMAVKEIGIPTGFSADVEGLELKKYPGVKRVEEGDRKVIIYYDELTSAERCVEVDAERTGLVAKAKPVAVRVYDYYEPENQQTIFYSSQRLNDINVCDVCGASCKGCAAYFKRR